MIRDAKDLKELGLLKYYRLVRKWACKTYGLNDADLELLYTWIAFLALHVMILLTVLTFILGIRKGGIG